MYHFILKLVEIFKIKKNFFEELKNSVTDVRKIVKEPALAYSEEEQEVILKHRPFHKDTGFLPLVNSLMKANNELVNYQDTNDTVSIRDKFGINISKNLAQCGKAVHQAYRDMMHYVEKEQYFLERWFKPVLEEISRKEDYREAWQESLSHFGNFLVILDMDLELFYNLLHVLKERGFLGETIEARNGNRATIKNNILISINANDFVNAKYWIKYGKDKEWFNKEEIELLNELIFFIEQYDSYQLEQIIESENFKRIFSQEETEFFQGVLQKIRYEIEKQIPISPEQLVKDLIDKAETLKQLGEAAKKVEVPSETIKEVVEETKKVEEAVIAVQETFAELQKIPEIKKFKKSKFRIKARFRLARREYKKNKKEVLNKGLRVLYEIVNVRDKLVDFIKSKLNKEKKGLEVLEQQVYSAIANTEETIDLKPIKVGKRNLWFISKDEIYVFLEEELAKVRQLKEEIGKITSTLASEQYKKRIEFQKKFIDYITSIFQRINSLKQDLIKNLTKINLKRKSKMALISLMLISSLHGIFPPETGTAYLRPKPKKDIARQILGHEAKEEEIQKMLETSYFVDGVLEVINKNKNGEIKYEELPPYIKELISDGILDIAIFVGVGFKDWIPAKKDEIRFLRLAHNNIVFRIRYIDNIKDAKKAFEECDVIHVESHSRYGLGWALLKEGMSNPLKMQPNPVKIPKNEIYGYKGPILKDLGNGYVIVQASDEDIKQINPRKGYQLISMGSCSSGEHFLEVIKRLRQGLPTTVIYTTDVSAESTFKIFLEGLLSGKNIEQITEEMNDIEEGSPYHAVVLNTESGSSESRAYDKHNIPNSITLFYDIET